MRQGGRGGIETNRIFPVDNEHAGLGNDTKNKEICFTDVVLLGMEGSSD